MKQIKIVKQNKDAIMAAIHEAEGRATERTLNYDDLCRIVGWAEKNPVLAILPKKLHVGADVTYRMGLSLPNSYSWAPQYTAVQITRRSTGWFLCSVWRQQGFTKQAEHLDVTVSKAQMAEAVSRFSLQAAVRGEMEVAA